MREVDDRRERTAPNRRRRPRITQRAAHHRRGTVHGGAGDPEHLRDVVGRDALVPELRALAASASSTLRGARTWCCWHGMTPASSGPLVTLLALAKQVSFLNIADLPGAGHQLSVSPGRAVRFPSVTGESEFSSI